ncbi:Bug family tripartite tricarboxylate transporter substrate binding protein [Paracraurococcus lichenis]|uniref:Tripartite tricarboxylate transporter substrate binding protein n=1 Tax=Paracraurococcus lichenis TaxID=3064888 RepID=A0ABT9E5P5_9PROT|nr:tripartite tricarboxylate transporter substrate binding protein [Paracraurococcus sp. LOR1-02]MDO9711489.1 tripartite tricarboxylate transporter substrate binding protein [Paracraurococcus sp. LOR1-02]
MMHRRGLLAAAATALATPALADWAAQRPITFVVAYGPGSANDIVVRLVQPGLSARLGQPVVIENRAGGGGTVGTAAVARARPDGHTLGLASTATTAINPALFRDLPYDPGRDFALAGLLAETPNLLIVPPTSPHASVQALAEGILAARAPLRHSSPGNGTTQHLNAVQFSRLVRGETEHVPYRGPAEGVQGVAAGEVEFGFASLPSALPQLRAGRVRALGITGAAPFPTAAEVPLLAELGYPPLRDGGVWFGIVVPRGTPAPVLDGLRNAVAAVRADPALAPLLIAAGYAPLPPRSLTEEEAFVARQIASWGDLVVRSGARIN